MNINLIIAILVIVFTIVIAIGVYFLGKPKFEEFVEDDIDEEADELDDYDLEGYDIDVYKKAEEEYEAGVASNSFLQKHWNKILPIVIIIGVLVSLLFLFRGYKDYQLGKEDQVDLVAIQNFYNDYKKDNEDDFDTVVEYGGEFTLPFDTTLLTLANDVSEEVDTMEVGVYNFTAKFKDNDGNLHEFDYKVTVEDTVPPVISGVKNIHLDHGQSFLRSELELSAIDPVDGKVDVKIEGDINTSVADAYEVLAVAVDRNGVRAEEPFVVVVASYDNNNPIRIEGGGSDKPGTPSTPVDTPTDNPVDTPADKPVDTPTDNPVDTPADKPVDTPTDKPVDTPVDNPVDTPTYKPIDKPVDKPVEKPTLLPIKEVAANVIRGDYGNNPNRKTKLEAEGYNYQEVQDEVNRLLK